MSSQTRSMLKRRREAVEAIENGDLTPLQSIELLVEDDLQDLLPRWMWGFPKTTTRQVWWALFSVNPTTQGSAKIGEAYLDRAHGAVWGLGGMAEIQLLTQRWIPFVKPR